MKKGPESGAALPVCLLYAAAACPPHKQKEGKMKTGLLLEGGAMRGLYTAAVLDVWMQNNILFDGIMGVSAGALFGMNYKSKQPGRVLR